MCTKPTPAEKTEAQTPRAGSEDPKGTTPAGPEKPSKNFEPVIVEHVYAPGTAFILEGGRPPKK